MLPPGDWDQKTLLPVMDMARKRAKIRRKKLKKKEELEGGLHMSSFSVLRCTVISSPEPKAHR